METKSRNSLPKKSTTVRFNVLAAMNLLAPHMTLERVFEKWCTPPRPRNTRVPKGGRPFKMETPTHALQAWEWEGRSEMPTVLLVHGWGGTSVAMEHLARALSEAGATVVAIDLPAHGQSAGTTTNLLEITNAVEAALWRFRPTAVIAHSLGATATALALSRGPHVDRVVLMAPGEEMSYFAHAFARGAGLSPEFAERLLARIESHIGVAPETLSLRNHPPPPSTKVLIVHDPADTDVPWTHVERLLHHWPRTTLGHEGNLRASNVEF